MNMIAILSKSILFRNIPESDISGLLETTAYRVAAYRPVVSPRFFICPKKQFAGKYHRHGAVRDFIYPSG